MILLIVDEPNNNPGDQPRRSLRRESTFDDAQNRGTPNADEAVTTKINFFSARRNVILYLNFLTGRMLLDLS